MRLLVPTSRAVLAGAAMSLAILPAASALHAQAPEPARNVRYATVEEADARAWLTYLSSDALQGRRIFTEGYGLAASYVADELKKIGANPMGDGGTYFQAVAQRRYRVTSNSSVSIERNGETRIFRNGDHVTFPDLGGGPQTLTFDSVEFVGYGRTGIASGAGGNDFTGRDVKGKLVVWLPAMAGAGATGRGGRATSATRSAFMVQALGAAAVISFSNAGAPTAGRGAAPPAGRQGGAPAGPPEVSTVERVDRIRPPVITADETFLAALVGGNPATFADLRAKAERGDPLEPFTISGLSVKFSIDATYEQTSAEFSRNVVAMVDGSDPALRNTYVVFGAHLDHVGYATNDAQPRGRANVPVAQDRVWNGADDDGSGSTALLAIAKAMVTGPRPKRSVLFIWHTGEEAGLLGSRFMADSPVVPLERIQAVINVDMIGRNRDDDPAQENTLFVIGADRISTDLHNLMVGTNDRSARPFRLDFEYNDPADSNSFYTRSDHYSYASKDIPIAFFFTGTHPDYHANTDSVDKIRFPKLVRVTQLLYEIGWNLADSSQALVRDRLGARAGVGFQGPLSRQ